MRKLLYFLLLGCTFLLNSCVYDSPLPNDGRLKIENKSNVKIYCYPSLDGTLNDLTLAIENKKGQSDNFIFDVIEVQPDSMSSIKGVSNWEEFIKLNSRDSTLSLFIFTADIVKNTNWKDIATNNIYSKKFVLNEQRLNTSDWKIIFRP